MFQVFAVTLSIIICFNLEFLPILASNEKYSQNKLIN